MCAALRRWLLPLILVLLSACGASAPPAETSALLAPTIMVINPVTAAPATTRPPTAVADPTPVAATAPSVTRPPANRDVAILRQGWYQDDQVVTAAFVVENTSDQASYERLPYQITLYTVDHQPVSVTTGTLMLLLPGATMGVVDHALVGAEVVALDLVIADEPAVPSPRPSQPIFEGRQSRFVDSPTPQVTGTIINNLTRKARQVQVNAIVYAADDTIIGGGMRVLATVDARSETAVAVPILFSSVPARVELWASFTAESFAPSQP